MATDVLNDQTVTVFDSAGLVGSPTRILPPETHEAGLEPHKEFFPTPMQTVNGIYLQAEGQGAVKARVFSSKP